MLLPTAAGATRTPISWFGERPGRRLEVRVEAFNAFNTTQFSNVGSSMSSSTFGRVTAAHAARRVQLGLRLTY